MKISLEKVDFVLRVLSFLALVGGGGWALYQYTSSGSNGWTNNITLETKVLPYHDNLRLLVVHVRSKNPRNYEYELKTKNGDSFELRIHKIALDAKENTVIPEGKGDLINKVDLLKEVGGDYDFLPGAEMDDMNSIVLPVNTIVELTADMEIHSGKKDKQGKPDTDFISASTVVRVEP